MQNLKTTKSIRGTFKKSNKIHNKTHNILKRQIPTGKIKYKNKITTQTHNILKQQIQTGESSTNKQNINTIKTQNLKTANSNR